MRIIEIVGDCRENREMARALNELAKARGKYKTIQDEVFGSQICQHLGYLGGAPSTGRCQRKKGHKGEHVYRWGDEWRRVTGEEVRVEVVDLS